MKIGDKLRDLRAKKNMSQQDLAKAIGVSDQAVSAWENNKKTPRMGAIEKLARFFEVPKTYLIDDDVRIFEGYNLGTDLMAGGLGVGVASAFPGAGPVNTAVLGLLEASGSLLDTVSEHGDDKTKDAMPIMVRDKQTKELVSCFRSMSETDRDTLLTLARSLAKKE